MDQQRTNQPSHDESEIAAARRDARRFEDLAKQFRPKALAYDELMAEQAELEKRLNEAELRTRTAHQHLAGLDAGLPRSLWSRIQGTTLEDMQLDAAQLVAALTGTPVPQTPKEPT